eukprot:XP_014780415.1 PREDICTED: beta-sarcoglycan-like isoform X1 [Octopus bimaculoides]
MFVVVELYVIPENHATNQQLSMRDKAQRKHNNHEHRTNFRAGFIPINEEYLHKTGIRGSKKKVLYCVVAFLLLVAIANIVVTGLLMSVLKLTPFGLQSLEFIPGGELLRFIVNGVLPNITLIGGQLGSRMWSGMNFTADQSVINIGSPESSMLSVNETQSLFTTDAFDVIDADTSKLVFSTDPNKEWSFPKMPQNLQTNAIETTNIKSRTKWNDIVFESFSRVDVKGDKGVSTEESINKINVQASKGISLNAEKGNLKFDASDGNIIINKKTLRPIKVENPGVNATGETFKLCICTPSGKLFAVPNTLNCLSPKDACNDT